MRAIAVKNNAREPEAARVLVPVFACAKRVLGDDIADIISDSYEFAQKP